MDDGITRRTRLLGILSLRDYRSRSTSRLMITAVDLTRLPEAVAVGRDEPLPTPMELALVTRFRSNVVGVWEKGREARAGRESP